jgi:uncharacterized phage-associated protein
MITINQTADYITLKLEEGGEELSHLKLQKLLYYVQAWHLAFTNAPLFNAKFQAWIHGPVSRAIYDRFAPSKSLYGSINRFDLSAGFDPGSLPEEAKSHIDNVLEVYAKYSGTQLEEISHREEPWISARRGYGPSDRCEIELDENLMAEYYRRRLS